jgi:FkbM family methyltransferase
VFRALARHVELNRFGDRVRLYDCALSDTSAEAARFFVSQSPVNNGLSSLLLDEAPGAHQLSGQSAIDVRTLTFDRWLEDVSLDRVDLLKMDVEGAELQVLRGMQRAFDHRRVRRIVCETTWDGPAHRLLVRHGYAATPLEPIGPLINIAYTLPD